MAQESKLVKSERRQRRSKECAEILDRLCEQHGTTIRSAHCRLMKSKRTIYILRYGEIDSELCLQQIDKTRKGVFPNGYKVGFEAFGQVWVAVYRVLSAEDNISTTRFGFEILPVNDEAVEMKKLSSGVCQSATAAFRMAVEKLWGKKVAVEEIYRPNGRLYVGIFYEEVQERITQHFLEFFSKPGASYSGQDLTLTEVVTWLHNRHIPSEPAPVKENGRRVKKRSTTHDTVAVTQAEASTGASSVSISSAGLSKPLPETEMYKNQDHALGGIQLDPELASTFVQIIRPTEEERDVPLDFIASSIHSTDQTLPLSSSVDQVDTNHPWFRGISPVQTKRDFREQDDQDPARKRVALQRSKGSDPGT